MSVEYASFLSSFLEFLRSERRYSPKTLNAYQTDLSQFFSFISDGYSEQDVKNIKAFHIKNWMYALLSDEQLSKRSVSRKLVSINTFYKYLIRSGEVEINPASAIQGPKLEKRLHSWIPENDIVGILDHTEWGVDFYGLRNKLIIELLYGTGIRLAELISLETSRVYLQEGSIKVLGKRNKERIVPANKSLIYLIETYIEAKKEKGWEQSQTLLLTDKGGPLYPMFVQRCVKRFITTASANQKVSPHTLRHTFATHLLNKGADINAIKELLGHSSLAATQIYTHNSIDRLKNIYKQSHPKG